MRGPCRVSPGPPVPVLRAGASPVCPGDPASGACRVGPGTRAAVGRRALRPCRCPRPCRPLVTASERAGRIHMASAPGEPAADACGVWGRPATVRAPSPTPDCLLWPVSVVPPRLACAKGGSLKSWGLCPWQVEVMDVNVEREKIAKEIAELERILDPSSSGVGVGISASGLGLDSDAGELSRAAAGARPAPSRPVQLGHADLGLYSPRRRLALVLRGRGVSALSGEGGPLSSSVVGRLQSSACQWPSCWATESHPHVLSLVLPWAQRPLAQLGLGTCSRVRV